MHEGQFPLRSLDLEVGGEMVGDTIIYCKWENVGRIQDVYGVRSGCKFIDGQRGGERPHY